MGGFVRAVEIWVPSRDGSHLRLQTGHYGALDGLRQASRTMRFTLGEGLPGRAWQSGLPEMVFTNTSSYFKRTTAAIAAGVVCGVALPYMSFGQLAGVVVFLCGAEGEHAGAIEIWAGRREGDAEHYELQDGYFGSAEVEEWAEDHIRFVRAFGASDVLWRTRCRRGETLPGKTIGLGLPCLATPDDIAAGLLAGGGLEIEHAVGIPWQVPGAPPMGVMIYSCRSTPIATRIEVTGEGIGRRHELPAEVDRGGHFRRFVEDGLVRAALKTGAPQLASGGRKWDLALPVGSGDAPPTSVVSLQHHPAVEDV